MRQTERLRIYEDFLHQMQMHHMLCNHEKIKEALSLIDSWSYAHRCGNGGNSDYEKKKIVEGMILKMKDFV